MMPTGRRCGARVGPAARGGLPLSGHLVPRKRSRLSNHEPDEQELQQLLQEESHTAYQGNDSQDQAVDQCCRSVPV